MEKIKVFSEKLGTTVTIKSTKNLEGTSVSKTKGNGIVMMGWIKTGWSKDSSWKLPR